MMEGSKRERRKFRRIPVALKVSYRKEGEPKENSRESLAENISEGGVLITSTDPIFISTILDLDISSPQLPEPIEIKGRVIWIQEINEGKAYELGVSFVKIADKDTLFIKRYIESVDLDNILNFAVKNNASDVHFVAGKPPIIRVYGELKPMDAKVLSSGEIKGLIYGFLNEQQKEEFEKELELDVSFTNDLGRFRVNVHQEKGQLGAAFRYIATDIKSPRELGLPDAIEVLARKPIGLVIVTGPTGSGKSTTLASMIEVINKERNCMIISLEDPIEYLYTSKKSIIKQREIGFDARSFVNALKHTLRQDVNVILVGEIRDLDSIAIAITAAETGHLVLTTLHTSDAPSSINRIIDVFPSDQQQQVRMQVADSLRGVISQVLLPRRDKEGRVVAAEVLVCTTAISNLIRQQTVEQIRSYMTTGKEFGMQTMDVALEILYKQGIISRETALIYAKEPSRFPSGI